MYIRGPEAQLPMRVVCTCFTSILFPTSALFQVPVDFSDKKECYILIKKVYDLSLYVADSWISLAMNPACVILD